MRTKNPKTYTITEAAKELGVSRAAVHAAIKKGRINARWGKRSQVIKTLLISEKELKAFEVDSAQQARGKKLHRV
jgi:excisionase family DNA binding protein